MRRRLGSSLYLGFNGKSAVRGRGRAPPSFDVTTATAKHPGTINRTLAFSAVPATRQESCSYDNRRGRAFDSVTQSHGLAPVEPERTNYPRAPTKIPIIAWLIVGRKQIYPATWFLIHEVQASSSKRGNVGGDELYALTAAGSSCCWSHSKNSMPASALISSPASRPIFSASAGAPTLLER